MQPKNLTNKASEANLQQTRLNDEKINIPLLNNIKETVYSETSGMMYLGTDNAEAKSWFGKAAANGHSQAMKQLSKLR